MNFLEICGRKKVPKTSSDLVVLGKSVLTLQR